MFELWQPRRVPRRATLWKPLHTVPGTAIMGHVQWKGVFSRKPLRRCSSQRKGRSLPFLLPRPNLAESDRNVFILESTFTPPLF